MKTFFQLLIIVLFSTNTHSQDITDTTVLKQSLEKATAVIRSAFEKGDAALVAQLHSPNVIKYFGGNNVIIGRDAIEKGAREWFQNTKIPQRPFSSESCLAGQSVRGPNFLT